MTQGIGIDIIEVERISRVIVKYGKKFLDRLFTEGEQSYCLRHLKAARHFAARFAAKEAIAKALGTGIRENVSWLDIEIAHDEAGKPIVRLSDSVKAHFNDPEILLSMSHCHDYATAMALRK